MSSQIFRAPVILKHFRKPMPVENKAIGGAFDPVTKADRGAEKAIEEALAARFPDHGIVGEEFGTKPGTSAYEWIIDPIDGTRSFIIGSPLWGTLIGVLKDGAPVFRTYGPAVHRRAILVLATRPPITASGGGRPARIKTRECPQLEDAILASTHPDLFKSDEEIATLEALKAKARLTPAMAAIAITIALLAAGHIDIIVEPGLKPYDIVALIPIIELGRRRGHDLDRRQRVERRRHHRDGGRPAARGCPGDDQTGSRPFPTTTSRYPYRRRKPPRIAAVWRRFPEGFRAAIQASGYVRRI